MARVRRILLDLLNQLISEDRRQEPYFSDSFVASDTERFEGGLVGSERLCLWRRSATQEVHARGMRLLRENLSRAQREQYERCWHFDVIGGETGRRYRIKNGFQVNVEQLDNKGRPVRLLCFLPKGDLVVGDILLAQKLALELFESDTLKVANTFSPDHSLGPLP